MAKKRKKRGNKGNGIGAHQQVSAMARGTRDPNKRTRQDRKDRQRKQEGWR